MKWKRHRDGSLQLGGLVLTPVSTPALIMPPNIPVVINTIVGLNVYSANYMPSYKTMLRLIDDCLIGFVYANKHSRREFMGQFRSWYSYRRSIDMDCWRVSIEQDVAVIEEVRIELTAPPAPPAPPKTIQERMLIVV